VMISYPVSWVLVAAGTGTMLIIICRKMIKKAVLAGKTKVLKDA